MSSRNIILYSVILVLIIICVSTCADRHAWREKAITAEANYEAEYLNSLHKSNGYTNTLNLTKEQFERREDGYLDSLNNILDENIKLSRVLRMTKFNINTKYSDRIIWRDSLILGDTIRLGRIISSKNECMAFDVFEPKGSDTTFVTSSLSVKGSVIVYKGKRNKQVRLFGVKLFRYGRRNTSAKMVTTCKDAEVFIQDVEVVKE
jgi:hypothetical protein